MDGTHYPSNGIIGSSAPQSYPSPTTLSPHQLQSGSPLPQTLPPLQPSVSAMQQPLYGSHPHTPRTPGTPNTPNSNANTNGTGHNNGPNHNHQQQHQQQQQQQQQQQPYQPQTSQPGGRPAPYAMAQNPYAPHQGYATSGAMMPQSTTAASHPQPIAPAPAGGRGPPVLRPMPPAGMPGSMAPLPPAPGGHNLPGAEWRNAGWMGQPEAQQEAPTHVVGSQGRRGILPSAPGRPAAPAAGTGTGKSTVIPVKDADGKFPCPHCTKTYLHAKHLKRHLLRHTGDRPYMCVLCRDTFSRSDILKRHFQKCSIRRGNPTGASHLSHPLAHVRRNQNNNAAQAQKPAGANEGDMNHVNGMSNMPPSDGMVHHPFGMVPVSDGMNNMSNDQAQLSRSSSMGNGNTPDRRSMPGPGMGNPQPYPSDVSNSMTSQQMPYSMPPGQNGMPMYGGSNTNQQSSLDWSQMFQAGAHQTYISNSFPPNLGQTQIATKTEPKTESDRATDERHAESSPYLEWGIPLNTQDAFTTLSNQILNFLYPPDEAVDPHLSGMNLHFSADNVKDFLDQYQHFHVHAPFLHLPTIRILEVRTGLLAAICCIGACYSERVGSSVVREMMDVTWSALQRDMKLMTPTYSGTPSLAEIEELQACLLMIVVHMWNGTPQHRERARQYYPSLASHARRLNLTDIIVEPQKQSPLHVADFDPSTFSPQHFDWSSWVEQESRIRLMLGIYVCDTAMGLYFNIAANFDPAEIHLPLPCDDAAWDASDSQQCAATLGLYGPESARQHNMYGTQRPKQPQFDWVLQTLLHNSREVMPGSTNLYGKFILVHALIAMIRRAHVEGQVMQLATPPNTEWVKPGESRGERNVQGEAAPDPRGLDALSVALDKFKETWDTDIRDQFPPQASGANNPRRLGFSRDAIHFYWTARYLLKFTNREDLEMAPDQRLVLVFEILKGVRTWVTSDAFARGEELGSIREIDDQFAIKDLDLTKLFKPLSSRSGEDANTPSVNTV